MFAMVRSLIFEYGIGWTINRSLYALKLKLLRLLPFTERFFERDPVISRIDLFDFDIEGIRGFLRDLPKEKQDGILRIGDKAIDGVIRGFSSLDLDYGNPINWQLNPMTALESSKEAWYRIPDFHKELGDIKVVWEASRFTHFFYFSRAYLITGDKKYYKAFSQQIEDWLRRNHYGYGANYKCGQEASLRMVNLLMNYAVFEASGLISEKDKSNIREIVRFSYKKVESNFFYAHKCIKNNHTFSEIMGLIVGAWCSDDKTRLEKAYDLLNKEIRLQFFDDGGYRQFSFNYQRFSLQVLEAIYKMSEKTGLEIEEGERIKNSLLLMYQFQEGEGYMPNYGSNDGALIFPMSTCDYRDFRPMINTLYALTQGERLYDRGFYDEELLWFGGSLDLPRAKIEKTSVAYRESGFYSIRHKDGMLATYLQDFATRPNHMDQLHLDLWHRGINVFCDSGTFSYASELGRDLSLTGGHNTLKLDKKEQMNKRGTFFVADWSKARDISFSDGYFKGTMVSKNGYSHRREIVREDFGYRLIDEVSGSGSKFDLIFHTPLDVELIDGGFKLYSGEDLICQVETQGSVRLEKAYRSLYYLKKEEINRIVVECEVGTEKTRVENTIKLR